MDAIFDWNLGNMIYNGLITLRLCGFPFAEIEVASLTTTAAPLSDCSRTLLHHPLLYLLEPLAIIIVLR